MTDSFTQGGSQGSNAPGWYPDRISPNLQKYWDGTDWIAQRRWINGAWVSEPAPGTAPDASGVAAGSGTVPRHASRPSTTSHPVTTQRLAPGSVGLFLFSVLVIVGSLTPWVTVSIANFSSSANGTDSSISSLIGVNGWVTFAGGLVLLILFVLLALQPEPLYRSLALVVAVVVAGFAVFDLVRIVQKISQASTSAPFNQGAIRGLRPDINVGWGLIVLAVGALGALVCAVVQARNS